jgi:hypothetical protein
MSKIIIPNIGPTREELDQRAWRLQRYQAEPDLRALADKIHSSRMMPPPACDQCIQMAIERMQKKS